VLPFYNITFRSVKFHIQNHEVTNYRYSLHSHNVFFHFVVACFPFLLPFLSPQLLYNRLKFFIQKKLFRKSNLSLLASFRFQLLLFIIFNTYIIRTFLMFHPFYYMANFFHPVTAQNVLE